jgi:hypothetical protein
MTTRVLGSVAVLALVLGLSGCSYVPQPWACETPAQQYALKVEQLVPTFRGSSAVVSNLAAASDGRYQVLAARISGATAPGEHPGSKPGLATWLAHSETIVEVTEGWNGKVSDGSTIDWPTARQFALQCLAGG